MLNLNTFFFAFLHRDVSDPGAVIHVCPDKDSARFTATVQLERVPAVFADWGNVEG